MLTLIALIAALQAQPSDLPAERERAEFAEVAASDAHLIAAEEAARSAAAAAGVAAGVDGGEGGMSAAVYADGQAVVAALVRDRRYEEAVFVSRMLEDRQAACRQASFVRTRLYPLADLVGDDNNDLALIYMWTGFTRTRSCGAPVGDPRP